MPTSACGTMTDWVFNALNSIAAGFQANPVVFSLIMAVGLFIIWLKWRLIGWFMRRAMAGQYAGWRTGAKVKQAPHETGVGTIERWVMRPQAHFKVSLLTFLFFGGGAYFYARVVLPGSENLLKDWGVFAIMCGFSMMAVFIFLAGFARIDFDNDSIAARGLVRKSSEAFWRDLEEIKPLSKTIAGGVRLHFRNGTRIKVAADMTGYHQLLQRLSAIDPKIALMTRMLETRLKKRG